MDSPVLSISTSPLPSDIDLIKALSEAIGPESGTGELPSLEETTATPRVTDIATSSELFTYTHNDTADPFGPTVAEHLHPVPLTIQRWRAEQRAKAFVNISADTCWRCGKTGHQRGTCPNMALMFCSRCGRIGTLSRDCTCQGGMTSRPRHENITQRSRCQPTIVTTPCPTCGCPNAIKRKIAKYPPPGSY